MPEADSGSYAVRSIRPQDIDAGTEAAWSALAQRSLEPNVYLAPEFILPALRYLDPALPVRILLIEHSRGGGRVLTGAGIFEPRSPTIRFPLKHWRAYRSCHSYLTGLLVDRDHIQPTIRSFLEHMRRREAGCQGIQFTWCSSGSLLNAMVEAGSGGHRACWHEQSRSQRAVLVPAQSGEVYLDAHLSASRKKELRRCWRRLGEQGEVTWRIFSGPDVRDEHIDHFLDLEHRGWKGEAGTSLRSKPAHEAFFREMIRRFRESSGVFFTELRSGATVVASTCNLISGNTGFAFKIGWHPDYARMSPGMLNELELVRAAPEACVHLSFIDSGADEGSFIDRLWMQRRDLVNGLLSVAPAGSAVAGSIDRLRRAVRWWRRDSRAAD